MVSTAHCCRNPSELAIAKRVCRQARREQLLTQLCGPWQRFVRLRLAGRAGIARSLVTD